MCFFANFWGDFVIVNIFSVLLFCEYLFADGRNDIWSSRGSRMWDVAIQIWREQVWLLSGLRSNRFADIALLMLWRGLQSEFSSLFLKCSQRCACRFQSTCVSMSNDVCINSDRHACRLFSLATKKREATLLWASLLLKYELFAEFFILHSCKHCSQICSRAKLNLIVFDMRGCKFISTCNTFTRDIDLKASKISKLYHFSIREVFDEKFCEIIEYSEDIAIRNGWTSLSDFLC